MAEKPPASDKAPIIVIKKIKKVAGGHHGGAWKVAYADFVTAMMAFFLLMWLLSSTSKEQRDGIAEYFDPTPQVVSQSQSGSGGVMGGITVSSEGAKLDDKTPVSAETKESAAPPLKSPKELSEADLDAQNKKREQAQFEAAKKQIEEAINTSEFKDVAKNLKMDMTSEGLRIQIVDQDGASMFPIGSAQPFAKTEKLLEKVAQVIASLPNQISVRGHTDGAAYSEGANYTNWELSSDRANSSRRVLLTAGIPETKIANVVGKADTDNYVKDNPLDPQNRRISIILLKQGLTKEAGTANSMDKTGPATAPPAYTPSQGKVQFP